jgi:hypothetical protein
MSIGQANIEVRNSKLINDLIDESKQTLKWVNPIITASRIEPVEIQQYPVGIPQ